MSVRKSVAWTFVAQTHNFVVAFAWGALMVLRKHVLLEETQRAVRPLLGRFAAT